VLGTDLSCSCTAWRDLVLGSDLLVRSLLVQARELAGIIKLFQNGVMLLDEVDLLLHPLKSELNFPLGQTPFPEPHFFPSLVRCERQLTPLCCGWTVAWLCILHDAFSVVFLCAPDVVSASTSTWLLGRWFQHVVCSPS
jgi:hypothetical protein